MRRILAFALPALVVALMPAQSFAQKDWYTKAVKNVTASFEPAAAKPGQTVTFRLTVELNDGYVTYPLTQKDKGAADMVNKIIFPKSGPVIFVGETADPAKLSTKTEQLGDLTLAIRYGSGVVTYTRQAVVSPKAAPGEVTVPLDAFKLNVCYEDKCYPEKTVPAAATLKVLDGPPVAIDPALAAEVAKALESK